MRTLSFVMTAGIMIGLTALTAHMVLTGTEPEAAHVVLAPATMPQTGAIDDRFQSYNVGALEVTGGRFWKPYGPALSAALKKKSVATTPEALAASDAELVEIRPPVDLENGRLRLLAAALGPAYVRVSSTAPRADGAALASDDSNGILGRDHWKGIVAFASAVDADIVTSFATIRDVQDAEDAATPEQARQFADDTNAIGGRIAAIELIDDGATDSAGSKEPAASGRDVNAMLALARQVMPGTRMIGPGAAIAANGIESPASAEIQQARKILAVAGASLDGVSYHYYGAASRRCVDAGRQTTAKAALSREWLQGADVAFAAARSLRDEFAPGKPIWLTETADARCGGNPWAATFLDTFRYLDQLGLLARHGAEMVAHHTLVSGDSGLIDAESFTPRPNYWAALLWRRLMGTTVLDPGRSTIPELHIYAHCLRGTPGGVVTLAINTDRVAAYPITVPHPSEHYTLSSSKLQGATVKLNDHELRLTTDGRLPALNAAATAPGLVMLAPSTITFLAFPNAANPAC